MTTFISYSRNNSDFALRLARDLREAGFDIWLDQLDIRTGARWDDEVEKALEKSTTFLIVLTPESIQSQNVKDEIGYAINAGKNILPIVLKPCNVPFRLRRFQYVDFSNVPYEESFVEIKHLLTNNNELARLKDATEDHRSIEKPVPRSGTEKAEPLHKRNTLIVVGIIGAMMIALMVILPPIFNKQSESQTPNPISLSSSEIVTSISTEIIEPSSTSASISSTPTLLTSTSIPTPSSDFWITYDSNINGNRDIFILNPVTGETRGVITDRYHDKVGSWSPDGKFLAFESSRTDPNYYQIYLYNGGQQTTIPLTKSAECSNFAPDWSPNGEMIVFYSYCKNEQRDIYVMNRDGSGRKKLTTSSGEDEFPAFSPNGNSITFTSTRNGRYQILLMNTDGSNQRVITDGCSSTFSPDGNWLWFSTKCDDSDIKRIQIDGSNLSTIGSSFGHNPSLAPDGKVVVFQFNDDIWIMDVDGSNPRSLTSGSALDGAPSWWQP
jgi:Tol biopolymer transport system component